MLSYHWSQLDTDSDFEGSPLLPASVAFFLQYLHLDQTLKAQTIHHIWTNLRNGSDHAVCLIWQLPQPNCSGWLKLKSAAERASESGLRGIMLARNKQGKNFQGIRTWKTRFIASPDLDLLIKSTTMTATHLLQCYNAHSAVGLSETMVLYKDTKLRPLPVVKNVIMPGQNFGNFGSRLVVWWIIVHQHCKCTLNMKTLHIPQTWRFQNSKTMLETIQATQIQSCRR